MRVAILFSGRGSNMEALVAAMRAEAFPAEPVLLLTNRPDAGGLHGAAAQTVPTAVVDHRDFPRDRRGHEAAMLKILHQYQVDIICLAGYMRLLTPLLVGAYAGRMLNIHPSLLPSFPGLDTHERALHAGVVGLLPLQGAGGTPLAERKPHRLRQRAQQGRLAAARGACSRGRGGAAAPHTRTHTRTSVGAGCNRKGSSEN